MRKVQTGFDRETGKPIYEEQPLDLTELPFIVVIIDEMADLMMVAGKEIEAAIQRLAQMARAAGIHIMRQRSGPQSMLLRAPLRLIFQPVSVPSHLKDRQSYNLGRTGGRAALGTR